MKFFLKTPIDVFERHKIIYQYIWATSEKVQKKKYMVAIIDQFSRCILTPKFNEENDIE